jgi:pimeloyl-ACP methyl ester carboxylesterase
MDEAEVGPGRSGTEQEALAEPELGSIAIGDLEKCKDQPGRPDYVCGSIEVPFEREDPSYGTTEIGFAVLPASGESEGAIFAVEGGPGFPSTGTAQAYRKLFGPLLETRDLVLVDQRGEGISDHADCPDLQRGFGPDALALANCAERLGKRFISYRTSAAADDIDWVRQALGYEEIALYGDSYGTFLGQSYAYRHGDKLEALVLDSAYPTFGESAWYPSLPKTGVEMIQVACDRSPHCQGDAQARLARGAEVLRHHDRTTLQLISALIGSAYSPASYVKVDAAMKALINGRTGPWNRMTKLGKYGSGSENDYSRAGEMAVSCNDYPMLWDKDASEEERREQFEEAIRNYPDPKEFEPFTPREIAYSDGTAYLYCLSWPAPTDLYEPPADPETQEPTEAPVLVINGEFDDLTTAHEGEVVAAQFPDSEQFIARNAGHVDALYSTNGDAARKIRAFLRRELG